MKNSIFQIKNFIFDFDGTLADTSKLIVATMQKTIKDYELPYRNDEQIKATIGVRLEEIPAILWPSLKGLGEPFSAIYRKNFVEMKDKIPVNLFPGVKETLLKLKEDCYQMAIATSRSHKSVDELTHQLGINNCFRYLLGGDDVSNGKPNPESIYKILSEMEWKPKETMMVGDMMVDIIMGIKAGISTCGVSYGNGKLTELKEANPNFIISEFNMLPSIIKCGEI